jgi:hygromycin-B 7''-O-kinase
VTLDGCDWLAGKDFPRQALGLAQHLTFDIFHLVGALLPLQDIGTLDDLATELFAV